MIYFVQEKGLFRSRVKIGFTDNVKNRLSGLRVSSPSILKLILLLPGTTQDEIGYHERFASYRIHGEWFSYGLKLRLFVWVNQLGSELANPESEVNLEPNPKVEPEPKPEIDFTKETEPEEDRETQEAIILRLNSVGKTRQEIAEHFGYQSNGGTIYRKMKKVLG